MASILDKYGIQEVCDVTFYKLNSAGFPTVPVLYLDTLKISTVETTAETTMAQGGKGNAPLIMWDYGKEITVTLEDALFSAKSLAVMYGDGNVYESVSSPYIMRTMTYTVGSEATVSAVVSGLTIDLGNGKMAKATLSTIAPTISSDPQAFDVKVFNANGSKLEEGATVSANDRLFINYDVVAKNYGIIEISADTFPGTYYVVGDTYARNEASGEDEFFQIVIPKAKVSAENTLTLEAGGDPSVFNLNLTVLRPADKVMMKLIKYDVTGNTTTATHTLIHNHDLKNPGT